MADEVFMDIPQVQKMAKDFQSFGDVLDGVSKALEVIINVLRVTAWISFGSTEAIRIYLEQIKPNVDKAASKMKELSGDVNSAVKAYAEGDLSGSRRFV